MTSQERREQILEKLKECQGPIKGQELSTIFQVSRQVIVQDIALLRAAGEEILATAQGYMVMDCKDDTLIRKRIVCRHSGYKEMEDELRTIVDLGGRVIDVIVEHPLYGEIKSPLEIANRQDLRNFMEGIMETQAEPLSALTEGVHIHTIEVREEESLEKIKAKLSDRRYLIKDK